MDMKHLHRAQGLPGQRAPTPSRDSPAAVAGASPSPSALRFDIQRISLPHSYTPTQRERFTTALTAALTQLVSQHPAGQVGAIARISHLEAERLGEGATPEEAALKIAAQILGSLHSTTRKAPRGAAGVTPHV
jgi:hypothetical protein